MPTKLGEIKNSETGETVVEMIGPANALSNDDALSKGLYALSEVLIRGVLPDEERGGLGGRFGYGADFENDVFMMHHYCWCESEDCLWCAGCKCPSDGDVEYYLDGNRVSDWSEANESIVAPMPHDVAEHDTPEYEAADKLFEASIAERERRLKTFYPAITHVCQPVGLMDGRERGEERKNCSTAPNFWHKASGFKVSWYKWMGRDMELNNEVLSIGEWQQIWEECYESLPIEAREKAEAESKADAEREADPAFQKAREEMYARMFQAMRDIHDTCEREGHDDATGHCKRCGLITDFEPGFAEIRSERDTQASN